MLVQVRFYDGLGDVLGGAARVGDAVSPTHAVASATNPGGMAPGVANVRTMCMTMCWARGPTEPAAPSMPRHAPGHALPRLA